MLASRKSGVCAILALLAFSGCQGEQPPPQLVTVQGTLLDENDRPLRGFGIVLHSQVSGGMRSGVADGDGKVTLRCQKGQYKVTLGGPPKAPPPPPDKIDDKKDDNKIHLTETAEHPYPSYQNAESTPWTLDVPEAGLQGFVLKIKND